MIRMIGLDLDGTLLNRQKEITEYTRRVLTEAIHRGVEIVPVTGRPYHGIPEQLFRIQGIRYVVTTNGASTYDRVSKKKLREQHIAIEDGIRLLRRTDGINLIREVFIKGYGYETAETLQKLFSHVRGTPIESYLKQSRKPVTDLYEFLNAQRADHQSGTGIEGISLMCDSEEEKSETEKRLAKIKGIRMVSPTSDGIEINHIHADKGEALLDLGHRLRIRKDEIMGIGDSDNDAGLLRSVGLPVAMGNASAKIKKTAQIVTDDHNHDGAAGIVAKILGIETAK